MGESSLLAEPCDDLLRSVSFRLSSDESRMSRVDSRDRDRPLAPLRRRSPSILLRILLLVSRCVSFTVSAVRTLLSTPAVYVWLSVNSLSIRFLS